jgi:hypothetical protein
MKKLFALLLLACIVLTGNQAFAALTDNRAAIAAQYGDYRLVVDMDGQIWTKAEWEGGGAARAKPSAYMYYFNRNGLNVQMEVSYDGIKPDAPVKAQRFTPDMAIKIKDLKNYFPEAYTLVTAPQAKVFATFQELTRYFRDEHSPVTLGVFVRQQIPGRNAYYPLLAFNIKEEGRLVKEVKYVTRELYIHEFTIERVNRSDADDPGNAGKDWEWLKNLFF